MPSTRQRPYSACKLHRSSTYLYIFEANEDDQQSPQLGLYDLSAKLDASSAPPTILSSTLPYWQSGRPSTIFLLPDGNVTAVSRLCGQDDEKALWRFRPDGRGNGTWTAETIQVSSTGQNGFLSEGIVFQQKANSSTPTLLAFGGMCPDAASQSWTSDAKYSDSLSQYRYNSDDFRYDVSAVAAKGGPIAEAGFSITTLPASVAAGTGTASQNYVLIGGHTQSAFINMSQVAIFSMPHASWTFLPVQQLQNSRTDLALRATTSQVEPRSGHTSILSDDGTKIIVFGGWVGDVNTPARPQLAVLKVGSGFGGSDTWQWTAPSLSGTGLDSSAGIYGHGATMLPGGIMLIHGGFSISSSSSRLRRTASSQTLLFNTTSNTWLSSYSAPASVTSGGTVQASAPVSDSLGAKIGLAVGLTLGFLILIGLLAFYFWYTRRLKRRAAQQGRQLESRSSDGSVAVISQPFLEKHSIDGRGGDMAALNHYWMNSGRPDMQPMSQNSATTGSFMDIPSPTRGLRKQNAARNYQYHAAPRYDEKRLSGSGGIHPIAEMDGEDLVGRDETALMSEAQRQLQEVERILQGNRKASASGPNPLRSHPVSPEAGSSTQADKTSPASTRVPAPKWRADTYTSGEASGRLSPTKTDDRTSSTLSEASHRSVMSNDSITRTMSTRTGRMLAAAAAAHIRAKAVETEAGSSSDARTSTMSTDGGRRTPHELGRSSTNASSVASGARSAAAESFRTARSTPQHERDALLYAADFDDPYRRARAADGQPTAVAGQTRRRAGLLGSLRKAIGVMNDRTMSLASSRGGPEAEPTSNLSSPVKERRNLADSLPRRTVSDGGALLRQKRGKQDWSEHQWAPYTDDPDPGDWGNSPHKHQAEEDWDVEDAVTMRDVQVMFTVPKARLRVVNADADRASLRSVSDGALSRAGSVRALAAKESRPVLIPLGEETIQERDD